MQYVVLVTWTTGKIIEKYSFPDLESARKHYKNIIQDTTNKRVLIVLAQWFAYDSHIHEEIIEAHFVEGISYLVPSMEISKPGRRR
jgi:hypothetical protein